ncbi:hypothetical protein, partial [Pseudomonas syringae group genomosp. 7]|uniref:hypothetical protein n=1 Tax=Pseudomonas syringae group genomosp. 7 TaxID=251699 RepID=UPI00376FD323
LLNECQKAVSVPGTEYSVLARMMILLGKRDDITLSGERQCADQDTVIRLSQLNTEGSRQSQYLRQGHVP